VLDIMPVESNLRESGVLMGDEQAAFAELGRATGTLVSFVPAHGESRVSAVAKPLSRTLTEGFGLAVLLADFENHGNSVWNSARTRCRLDGRTWGAFVYEADGLKTLDAYETHPRHIGRLMDYARANYSTILADLTGAREVHAGEVLRASDAVFLVTGSDHASLAAVREKAEWLQSMGLGDRVALLLERSPDGADADQVEDQTGLPVCSLIETEEHIEGLGRWFASNARAVQQSAIEDVAVPDYEFSAYALAG
jgi:hypothetical protein